MNNHRKKSPHSALLTGATGFIGFALANRLLQEGWNVHLLVRENSNVKKLDQLSVPPKKLYRHDGTTKRMLEIMHEAKPDTVFHLASQVVVTHEPEHIESLICSNVTLGTQLLEAMVQCKIRYLINAGSFWQHYESDGYCPVNLYAATKQAFEDVIRYYTECCGIKAITLKLFNVYGPDDTRDKLFGQLNRAFEAGESLAVSRGEQLLDLVYVEDVVEAFMQASDLIRLASQNELQSDYAVSSSNSISLKDAVTAYQRITGRTVQVAWGSRPYRERDVMKPWRGKPLPGWKAKVSLEEGIRRMVGMVGQGKKLCLNQNENSFQL